VIYVIRTVRRATLLVDMYIWTLIIYVCIHPSSVVFICV